jgi:SAM-dependent methyltransferase
MMLSQRSAALLFALTLFVSAALLFSVQPMIAKMLLPLLGGTPAVWNTCMVFFQAALLAGYAYALFVSKRPFHQQVMLQLVMLLVAFISLPIGLSEFWVNSVPASGNPSLWLLACLLVISGLPFFIVSSNGPLLQKWFAHTGFSAAHDPYFLYSASNAGSFVALLSYPILFEPIFKLRSQSLIWTAGYALLLLLVALCGFVVWRVRRNDKPNLNGESLPVQSEQTVLPAENSKRVTLRRRLRWILLAFVPSSLMLGVTNYISTDIASVPLLWIVPLSLYLLTMVLAFARHHVIPLRLLSFLLPVFTILLVINNIVEGVVDVKLMIGINLVYFFIAALTCHQQLALDRPSTAYLTEFYFWLSLGGVLGGVFNALLAPVIFNSVAEYPLIVVVACLLLPVNAEPGESPRTRRMDYLLPAGVLLLALSLGLIFKFLAVQSSARIVMAVAAPAFLLVRTRPVRFALCLAALLLVAAMVAPLSPTLYAERNFFGVLRVSTDENAKIHWLFHGSTNHGRQSMTPEQQCEALSYFHREGPLGPIFASFHSSSAVKNVAVVGLGTGATAVYALPNERWTFYEINPAVVDIARNPEYFTYITACNSVPMNIVLGDARLRLRDAPDAAYGLIVLDAFSSDAIPLHLITQQALDLYLSKLAPGGLLAFHISNRHLDLSPVMADLAASRNLQCIGLYDAVPYHIQGRDTSVWVVMTREPGDAAGLSTTSFARTLSGDSSRRVWTDDFSNILSVLKW